MFSMEAFQQEYETDTVDVAIRNRKFSFLVPKSLDRFVDPENVFNDFPLWAKIWEPSVILADYLASMPVNPEKSFLEIGSGLGLVGIVASSFGHKVTMTEYKHDALNFAKANAHINDCSNLKIMELDWNRPELEGTFDKIIGSEVIYKEQSFYPILRLFQTYLKEDGEIVLAERPRRSSIEFFRQMSERFNVRAQKKIIRNGSDEIRVMMCRMTFKRM
ncbi:MAG: methyltransferase domain-containing protein [Proteobacteria bacterium]|nr:methyltransferase domain-containing protein [Pseudomonadota bacterium]MBU4389445.1 methyltransferase domain-containing protein [Pseudomonadota bacterium]MBU4420545.1 methyltransferase domain-containing protein [Pseudomonadota bacterium]MBU4503666.1 methyltransferase domain-containing protein [Pseudomonadota bacterium]MCG2830331.1 protein N-lysine methyltransferase family protein [Desulfobacteraceae bacterium]